MVSDGLRWSQMVLDGLSQYILITIEWFKTPKPISGLGLGWMDGWMGLDLRVGGGIEHLTVLISEDKIGIETIG